MALLILLIGVRILRGDIPADGVLLHNEGDASVAPERALTMAIFPVVIISYAYTALNMNLDVPGWCGCRTCRTISSTCCSAATASTSRARSPAAERSASP